MSFRYLLPLGVAAALGIATAANAEESVWTKAGREIGEAGSAVGHATVETSKDAWEATKSGAGKAWDKTKELSGDAWDATKEAVHEGAEYVEEKTE